MNDLSTNVLALLPLLVICATVVTCILAVAVRRHHFTIASITVVGLNVALFSVIGTLQVTPVRVTPLFIIDDYSVIFTVLALLASLACATLAYAYLEKRQYRREEFYILLLCSVGGAIALVCSRHLASLFIGLELLSVPMFGMIAYSYRDHVSLEAGFKYLVLSSAASAFLLFGMALMYAVSGTMTFSGLAQLATSGGIHESWLLLGAGMLVVALSFKLSLVPFHLWTPDVYEGAPSPVSAYLATVSKLAVFALLMRFFLQAAPAHSVLLKHIVTGIAIASMILGNVLALRQNNIKRLLGYSAIAHMGYLLTAIVAGGAFARETVGVYLAAYVLTTLGAFGVVTLVSNSSPVSDAGALHHYRGLFWRRPYLASILTVMMLSLAGVPMTLGFIGKFYALAVGMQAHLWWMVGSIVVGSGIALYYYLRVAITLFLREPGQIRRPVISTWGQQSGGIMVLLIAIAVIVIGIYPHPLILLAKAAGFGG